jgi:hypothetical protein
MRHAEDTGTGWQARLHRGRAACVDGQPVVVGGGDGGDALVWVWLEELADKGFRFVGDGGPGGFVEGDHTGADGVKYVPGSLAVKGECAAEDAVHEDAS